jgi:hypothetical protein
MESELLIFRCLKNRHQSLSQFPLNYVKKNVFQNWFGEKYFRRKIVKYEFDSFVDVFYLWREIVSEYVVNKELFQFLMDRAYNSACRLFGYACYDRKYHLVNPFLKRLLQHKRKIDIGRGVFDEIFEHIDDENLKMLKNSFDDKFMISAVSSEIICRGKFWIAEKLIDVVKIDPKFLLNEILKSGAHTKICVSLITVVNNTLRLKKLIDEKLK